MNISIEFTYELKMWHVVALVSIAYLLIGVLSIVVLMCWFGYEGGSEELPAMLLATLWPLLVLIGVILLIGYVCTRIELVLCKVAKFIAGKK